MLDLDLVQCCAQRCCRAADVRLRARRRHVALASVSVASINRSLPLAVVPTNASINDRLRCISSTLHPKHSVQKRGSQRAKITTKALCISSQQRNSTDGSGKRQHQRTVCQASRASMSDSLEEVRAAVTLPKLSKHRSPLSVLLQRRWDFVTALQPCFVSLLTSLKQRH